MDANSDEGQVPEDAFAPVAVDKVLASYWGEQDAVLVNLLPIDPRPQDGRRYLLTRDQAATLAERLQAAAGRKAPKP